MADTPTSTLPLAEELGLVKYLQGLTGIGTNSSAGTYTATPATATPAQRLTSDELGNIMTDWLRGSGNFLETMRQQNTAGLYNTSTRRLLANDLMAQAALKAAGANQNIDIANAKLATEASLQNAKQADLAAASNARVSATNAASRSTAAQNALAALIAAYNKYNKEGKKSGSDKTGTSGEGESTKQGSGELTSGTTSVQDMQSLQGGNFEDYAASGAMLTEMQPMATPTAEASTFTSYGDFTSAMPDTFNSNSGDLFGTLDTPFDSTEFTQSYEPVAAPDYSSYSSYGSVDEENPYSWVDAW